MNATPPEAERPSPPKSGARRLQWAPRRRTLAIAALLFGLCFGVYGILAPPRLQGYEGETGAVAEGIFRGYGAKVPPDTELVIGESGWRSRTGILQPVLMVPFYAVGAGIDELDSGSDEYTYRSFILRLYSGVITALAAVVLFLLVRVLGRSEGWALAISLLFALASIALPYAGMGMEPTGMLAVMTSFLVAAHAARTGNLWLWALTGAAIGVTASARPGGVLAALGALVLLWPTFRAAEQPQRRRLLAALATPAVLGLLAFLAYNVYRFDDPFETGYEGINYTLGEAPFAALGLYLSPGKGLLWYSPLVILGLFGLAEMWRRERTLAVAITSAMVLGTLPFLAPFWSDDTWGPRYMLSIAWLPLLPIAWWATTRRRRMILAGFAAVAVWVQLTGALVGFYAQSSALLNNLTGAKVYGHYVNIPDEDIPYGDDSVRWIPALSPLLFNSEALISIGQRNLGLGDREFAYRPFGGHRDSISLSYVPVNVWWNAGAPADFAGIPNPSRLWLIPFVLLTAGSALGLTALRREPAPPT